MMRILVVVMMLIVTGCAPMFVDMTIQGGQLIESTAMFDGASELSMVPAWICKSEEEKDGCFIRMKLFHRSSMPKDEIILYASASGTRNIADGESLWFNVDGEKIGFTSIDQGTTYEQLPVIGYISAPWSTKRYLVDRAFLKKLILAKQVIVRLDLGQTYLEGLLNSSKEHHGQKSFESYYHKFSEVSL